VKSLVTEFAEEKRKERELEQRQKSPFRRFVAPALASVACVAAWLVPVPEAGDSAVPSSPQYTMASARMTLVLASRRLESFRTQYRRLPTTLDDAGVSEPQMQYRTAPGETFVLKLPVAGSYLTLDSGMAPAMFMEDALSIIRRTAR
jgi:ferric-dicitrate binding protein FerR (iron transport regulator)